MNTETVVILVGFLTMVVQQGVSMYTAARNHRWDVEDRKRQYEASNDDRAVKAAEAQQAVNSQTSELKHLVRAVGEKASAELQEVAATVAVVAASTVSPMPQFNRRKGDPKP